MALWKKLDQKKIGTYCTFHLSRTLKHTKYKLIYYDRKQISNCWSIRGRKGKVEPLPRAWGNSGVTVMFTIYTAVVSWMRVYIYSFFDQYMQLCSGGIAIKNPPTHAGAIRDKGVILGSRRSPGEGCGNPCQYSCLENSMDRGAWQTIVHGTAKSQTWLCMAHTHILIYIYKPVKLYTMQIIQHLCKLCHIKAILMKINF